MKTKIIILIAISAVVTLSFTFASTKKPNVAVTSSSTIPNKVADEAPIGGFAMEDKL